MQTGGCSELYGYDCVKAEIYCMQILYCIFKYIKERRCHGVKERMGQYTKR